MDELDTASSASPRKSSESLRKISFRIFSDVPIETKPERISEGPLWAMLLKREANSAVFACGLVLLMNLVEDRAPFGQRFARAGLVSAHEAAVALHIRCEDCDEAG